MKIAKTLPIVFASAMLLACSSETADVDPGNSADAMGNNTPTVDAAPGTPDAAELVARIPSWTLEDIQTDSAMFGQTYGLDTFSDKILIAVVVAGF